MIRTDQLSEGIWEDSTQDVISEVVFCFSTRK